MDVRLNDIEMIYIQSTSGDNSTVECIGKHHKNTKSNFADVEGIEKNAIRSVEIKQSFIQMSEEAEKIWNINFKKSSLLCLSYSF